MTDAATTDATPADVTLREVKELVRTFAESSWESLELRIGDLHLVLGHPVSAPPGGVVQAEVVASPVPAVAAAPAAPPALPAPVAAPSSGSPAGQAPLSDSAVEVRSTTVGAFWVSPSPGQPPFVAVGQKIAANEQLAIVEVMKLMNHVSSPCSGTVVRICVLDSTMVEYDQVLFVIEPDDG